MVALYFCVIITRMKYNAILKSFVAGAIIAVSFSNFGEAAAPSVDNIERLLTMKRDITCLAQVIHDEARGEPLQGKIAVGNVVMNRVKTWKRDVCEVVYHQRGKICQFSGMCSGKKPYTNESFRLAFEILNGYHRDNTNGATYFHANYVKPKWNRQFKKTVTIGNHHFYYSNQTL